MRWKAARRGCSSTTSTCWRSATSSRPGRARARPAGSTSASTCTATCGRAGPRRPHGGAACALTDAGPRTWLLATLAGWALLRVGAGAAGHGRPHRSALADDPALVQRAAAAAAAAARAARAAGAVRRNRRAPAVLRRPPAAAVLAAAAKATASTRADVRLRPDQRADHAGLQMAIVQPTGRRRFGADQARRGADDSPPGAWSTLQSAQRGVRRPGRPEARWTCACSTARWRTAADAGPSAAVTPGSRPMPTRTPRPDRRRPRPRRRPKPTRSRARRTDAEPAAGGGRTPPRRHDAPKRRWKRSANASRPVARNCAQQAAAATHSTGPEPVECSNDPTP